MVFHIVTNVQSHRIYRYIYIYIYVNISLCSTLSPLFLFLKAEIWMNDFSQILKVQKKKEKKKWKQQKANNNNNKKKQSQAVPALEPSDVASKTIRLFLSLTTGFSLNQHVLLGEHQRKPQPSRTFEMVGLALVNQH